jgi:hypothetical protein
LVLAGGVAEGYSYETGIPVWKEENRQRNLRKHILNPVELVIENRYSLGRGACRWKAIRTCYPYYYLLHLAAVDAGLVLVDG